MSPLSTGSGLGVFMLSFAGISETRAVEQTILVVDLMATDLLSFKV